MSNRSVLSIRHASRRLQVYRLVKFVIRHLFSAFKSYHKFPSTIASDARTKADVGRGAMSPRKRPVINRNAGDNVNSHGVSNSLQSAASRVNQKTTMRCRCQGLPQIRRSSLRCIIIREIIAARACSSHISMLMFAC